MRDMSFRAIAVGVCKREGKKIQMTIAQVSEVLKVLVDWNIEHMKKNDGDINGPVCSLDHRVHRVAGTFFQKKATKKKKKAKR